MPREEGKWIKNAAGQWEWKPANGNWLSFTTEELQKYGRGPLTNPDHPPTEEKPVVVNTTAKPTPYGGYWQLYGKPKRWMWVNTTQPVTIVPVAGASYEDMVNPKQDPDGNPNTRYSGEKFPDGTDNPNYIPPDVNAPSVTVQDGWPPSLEGKVPQPEEGSTPPPAGPPPSHPAYWVDGSSIRECEEDILTAAKAAVDEYESLKNYVADTKWWIFSAGDRGDLTTQSGHHTVTFDPNLATTRQLSAASDNLLLNTADAIHSAGAYIEALNAAGQLYSRADLDSFTPET